MVDKLTEMQKDWERKMYTQNPGNLTEEDKKIGEERLKEILEMTAEEFEED